MQCDECTRGEGHLAQIIDLLIHVFIFLLFFFLQRPKEGKLLRVADVCEEIEE